MDGLERLLYLFGLLEERKNLGIQMHKFKGTERLQAMSRLIDIENQMKAFEDYEVRCVIELISTVNNAEKFKAELSQAKSVIARKQKVIIKRDDKLIARDNEWAKFFALIFMIIFTKQVNFYSIESQVLYEELVKFFSIDDLEQKTRNEKGIL